MIRWRRVALQYPCENCGAAPGHKCITTSGVLKYEIHQYRTNRAEADHWRDWEDEDDDGRTGRARPRPGDDQ